MKSINQNQPEAVILRMVYNFCPYQNLPTPSSYIQIQSSEGSHRLWTWVPGEPLNHSWALSTTHGHDWNCARYTDAKWMMGPSCWLNSHVPGLNQCKLSVDRISGWCFTWNNDRLCQHWWFYPQHMEGIYQGLELSNYMQNDQYVPFWPEAESALCSWLLDIELKIKFVWVPKEFILICDQYQYTLPNAST